VYFVRRPADFVRARCSFLERSSDGVGILIGGEGEGFDQIIFVRVDCLTLSSLRMQTLSLLRR
jgi:hypothetical protein